ncbi:MAG: cytochrome d ubiquinol oxidase subunit II [Deltaproteobacteria bacterium]|nr:cytochrome d ubiquinol oxidase subunit II [Deltaproteobacteria bacterium]
MNLIHIWVLLVGLVVILYVLLDGFSLGVGLLFFSAENEVEQDVLIGTIAPVWDANQTWIVFGGGALFASFPMIYTVLFSALYIPLFTFLFGLIFRGVAFEFRTHSHKKQIWNHAFFWGSFMAAFAQGITLGGYISGIQVRDNLFAGGPFDWLTPFSIMTGIALVTGYVLLGSTYIIIKTTGPVQARAYRQAFLAACGVALFIATVFIWTPYHNPEIIDAWLSKPRVYVVWILPVLGSISFVFLFSHLKKRSEIQPFIWSLMVFLSAYLALQSAIFPFAILPGISIYAAASQSQTLSFTLWGVALILPVVLGYIFYSYRVFRGKIIYGEGYE